MVKLSYSKFDFYLVFFRFVVRVFFLVKYSFLFGFFQQFQKRIFKLLGYYFNYYFIKRVNIILYLVLGSSLYNGGICFKMCMFFFIIKLIKKKFCLKIFIFLSNFKVEMIIFLYIYKYGIFNIVV